MSEAAQSDLKSTRRKGRTRDQQFVSACLRIEMAKTAATKTLLLHDLRRLKKIPVQIEELTTLEQLVLGPNISDFAVLASLAKLKSLILVSPAIQDLASLPMMPKLQTLRIVHSRIRDLSGLARLSSLRTIDLENALLSDIGFLSRMSHMHEMRLGHTQISDLRPLSAFPGLHTLWINSTPIKSVAPLCGNLSLVNLSMAGTLVSDITPLAKLKSLQTLSLQDTRVHDITPLSELKALEGLSLANTHVSDISPLSGLPALQRLRLDDTPISDLSPIERSRSLISLWIRNTKIRDLKAVARMTRMQDAVTMSKSPMLTPPGLYFAGSVASQIVPFDKLAQLPQPACTVETINEVRRQNGVSEYLPEDYAEAPVPASTSNFNDDVESGEQLGQKPASHTFNFRDGRIEAQPQIFLPRHVNVADDIRVEVSHKAKEVAARLVNCNAPKRLISTVERLGASLGLSLQDLRAGILQMRFRSLEADLVAYDTEDGRKELPDDAFAMLRDLGSSVEDLMGCFPQLADIEAERLAQRLKEVDVPQLVDALSKIRSVAEESEAVAPSAIEALKTGEPELQHSAEIVESGASGAARIAAANSRDRIVGYMLLVYRNFIAGSIKAGNELAGVGSATWQDFRTKAPEQLSDTGVALIVATLVNGLLGPTAALGAFAVSFKPLRDRAKRVAEKLAANRARSSKEATEADADHSK
jgi:Leucine-rich repeat (LRR) protein